MLAGKISKLNLAERTLVVLTDDGREITAKVPHSASIEVSEPEAMGTMGGSLEDLEEGFLVELDVHEVRDDHPCTCISVVSIS
jgi:hypothetical protein